MNATELFVKEGKSAGIYFCGQCRCVARTQEEAERCCKPYACDKCGKEILRYHTRCNDCDNTERARIERERFDKAEKLTEWIGWVYCEGLGFRDGFFESITELFDALADEESGLPEYVWTWPEYVWTCTPDRFVHADVSDITDRMADQAYEDWDPADLNGLEELKAALDKFNEANKDAISYSPDYTKAVLLKPSLQH